jgi:hypothetical protein
LSEWTQEEKLIKKLKKGQISLKDFKEKMAEYDGGDFDEEDVKALKKYV